MLTSRHSGIFSLAYKRGSLPFTAIPVLRSSRPHFILNNSCRAHSLIIPSFNFFSTKSNHDQPDVHSNLVQNEDGYFEFHDPTFRREIWRHILFASAFCVTSMLAAAYFERKRRESGVSWKMMIQHWQIRLSEHRFRLSFPPNDLKERIERMLGISGPWSPGQKTSATLLALNFGVFGLWSLAKMAPNMPFLMAIMENFFLSFPPARRYSTHITAVLMFSHSSLWHLAFNSWALWSFGPHIENNYLAREQFVGFFLSAGVFSSVASMLAQVVRGRYHSSLGASGAIFGLLSFMTMLNPHAEVRVLFAIPAELWQGLAAVTLFDLAGLFFRFRSISMDHAAHLGGSLFGALYAAYGLPLWRRRDELFGASLAHNKADGTHIPIIKKSDREKK